MKRLLLGLTVLLAMSACADPVEREPSSSRLETPAVVEAPVPTEVSPPVPQPRVPERLRLWKFEAPVVKIPLTNGALVPPSDPQVLGWWGRRAGAPRGTTLLTGHTVSTGGGTFDDLEETPLGKVALVSGVRYEVVRVEVISKEALARRAPVLFSQTRNHRLMLVTCENYDPATGEYGANVVVALRPIR